MIDDPWPNDFPAREVLRADVEAMAEAWRTVLLEELGAAAIDGLYLKGSAAKRWDSLVDYVPELSDVDLHVRLSD